MDQIGSNVTFGGASRGFGIPDGGRCTLVKGSKGIKKNQIGSDWIKLNQI